MKLLRKMMALQHAQGAVTDDALRGLAKSEGVPLYRLEGLRGFYPVFRETPGAPIKVDVCRDMVCAMRGGPDHCRQVKEALSDRADVEVHEVSCLGRCDTAPAAAVNDIPISGTPDEIAALVGDGEPGEIRGGVVPESFPTDPYADGGEPYRVLREALAASDADVRRDDIISILKECDLRGLGGAAFPTGMKWDFTRKAAGEPKYVICNADESEPGTFKDRVLLEYLPHLVIEAMVLGAWVIGARRGIVYVRHEYGPETEYLQKAIDAAYAAGALGENIFGAGFDFDLEVFVSPGGYILGEEMALLEALEDKRGEPRNKPPFPTNVGLWGKPTLMNNVETFAAIPMIVERGPQWWEDQGRGEYKGLKYVCVSGDVTRPGVYCIPWGATVAEVLEMAGGTREGRELRAFSPGGSSTNFLPADKVDTPMDFKALQEAGSGLGTAAMVYLDDSRDMVDMAMYQVRFFRNESCGKCVPCRVGTHKAVQMMENTLNGGQGPTANAALLTDLDETLAKTSICGLGQVALTPLMSVINQFPDEPNVKKLKEDQT